MGREWCDWILYKVVSYVRLGFPVPLGLHASSAPVGRRGVWERCFPSPIGLYGAFCLRTPIFLAWVGSIIYGTSYEQA